MSATARDSDGKRHGPLQFFGRTEELAWLRGLWDSCTQRDVNSGKFIGGPRMAVIIAESGIGKSRLVQELYLQLTSDAQWDPPEFNYWPDAFQSDEQLQVNPATRLYEAEAGTPDKHNPLGPPRFLWLGVRWQSPDARNVEERKFAIPAARDILKAHVEIAQRYGPAWQQLLQDSKREFRKKGGIRGAVGDLAVDFIGELIPLGGLIAKFAKTVGKTASDRNSGARSLSDEQATQQRDAADEFLDEMTETLGGKNPLPVVLWLDDAQWIDPQTLGFITALWEKAQAKSWPLLIVATHWEREWKEILKQTTGGLRFTDFNVSKHFGQLVLQRAGADDLAALVRAHLPGLTPAQCQLLQEKADGNHLTMIENIGELTNDPQGLFVDDSLGNALTKDGEDHAKRWESQRQQRVEQRFKNLKKKVKDLLGWSSELGTRFLKSVILEYAKAAGTPADAPQILEQCEDPLVILGTPSQHTREFRDRAFYLVAKAHFMLRSKSQAAALHAALEAHFVHAINLSFDAEGALLWNEEESTPAGAAVLLELGELRDLLGMAIRELALPAVADWSSPVHAAALRARVLASWIEEIDGQYARVREQGLALADLRWSEVPLSMLDEGVRWQCAEDWMKAGALRAALGLHQDLLARARAALEEEDTPERRRDVSLSLNKVAGIEQTRGDLDAAFAKYSESLDIARTLLQEEDTPRDRNGSIWTAHLLSGCMVAMGHASAALELLANMEQEVDAFAKGCEGDGGRLDTAACYWEVRGAAAAAADDSKLETRCKHKAKAIRNQIKKL